MPAGAMPLDSIYPLLPCCAVSSHEPLTCSQTAVNNKENQVSEFDDCVLPASRPPLQLSKLPSQSRFPSPSDPNCVGKWQGKIPLTPCSPGPSKPRRLSRQADCLKLRSSVKLAKQAVDPSLPNSPKFHASQLCCQLSPESTAPTFHLSNNKYDVNQPQTERPTGQPAALEVKTLLAKLEELGTTEIRRDHDGWVLPEPLPENAICPGAPKLPSTFALLYSDPADDGEEQDLIAAPKSPSLHQVSPLAEVTEAYTGMQGAWSPPLETVSPVSDGRALATVNIFPGIDIHQSDAAPKSKMSKAMDPEFKLDCLAPRLKRRRAHQGSIESPSVNHSHGSTKSPLRI